MSAVAVASASAASPEFKPVTAKNKLVSSGGAVTWTWGTTSFTCSKSTATGEITSASTIGKTVVKLTECTADSKACEFKSAGAGAGEIVTNALKGELGTTSQATSGVGILLAPETGKKWAEIESTCTSPATTGLNGSLAAEVAVIGKKQSTNKLVFGVTSGSQNITEITLDGKKVKPEMEGWGVKLTMSSIDEVTFQEALEVT